MFCRINRLNIVYLFHVNEICNQKRPFSGCGHPYQPCGDANVVITGSTVCPPGTFNSLAQYPEDCFKCYCSEVTDQCTGSSDLYLSKIDVPIQSVTPVVDYEPTGRALPGTARSNPTYANSATFYFEDDIGGMAYFEFPMQYSGNQVKSYGGTLSYVINFEGSTSLNGPDVIISGNGIKLFYSVDWRPRLSTDNEIKVKFLPGKWLKNDPVGPLATREDILTVLQSVDHILLR